jgi:hypothetical protein
MTAGIICASSSSKVDIPNLSRSRKQLVQLENSKIEDIWQNESEALVQRRNAGLLSR